MTLQELSFRPEEIFPCEVQNHRALVPATVNGESVYLALATELASPAMLTLDYASTRGFEFEDEREVAASAAAGNTFGKYSIVRDVEVQVFRRGFRMPRLSVLKRDYQRTISSDRAVAGAVGIDFLRDGVLGIDLRDGTVGFARREGVRIPMESARYRLRLAEPGVRYVPITRDLLHSAWLRKNSGPPLVFLLSTGVVHSSVSFDYIRQVESRLLRWSAKRLMRKALETPWTFDLPGGQHIEISGTVEDSYAPLAQALGVERIDGILGMKFFERWLTVFDFPTGEVGLFE